MADFAAVQESDLEDGNQPSEGLTGDGAGALSKNTYQPVNDNDLAPVGPSVSPAFRGFRGGIPNIPTAAAQRFNGDVLSRIFGAGVKKFAEGYSNSFQAMTDADKQTLAENGYGQYSGPGALLQHAADTFNSGLALAVDGFFALGPAISEGVGGVEGQIARETGAPEDVAKAAEREGGFIGQAAQMDIGTMHGASMIDAAKANAAVPGVYGHAYRLDRLEDGSAALTPLGRLPSEAEAAGQAKVAADALHLPPSTADLIHQTYLDTGRPPAEVYLDAKTNNGGVLSDLVAGKVPTAYQGPARALTPEEIEAAKTAVNPEGEAAAPAAGGAETPLAPPLAPTGVSKVGKSIEAKAVEEGLTQGFGQTAGYDKITIADQAQRTADLINTDLDKARAVIRGDEPLPSGMKGTALITAMEDYIKKNPDADLAYELANSPLVTGTSEAAQEMRLAAERTPDSAAAKLAEIKAAQERAVPPRVAQARKAAIAPAWAAAEGVFLPKEQLSIDNFLNAIKC